MKICHLSSVHSVHDNRIYYKECATLAAKGYQVFFVAPDDGLRSDREWDIGIVNIKRRHNKFLRLICSPPELLWRAFAVRADLYHFHDPELLPVCFLLRILSGKPVIYDIHEDVRNQIYDKAWLPALFKTVLSSVYDILEKIMLGVIDHLILAEDSYAQIYGRYVSKATVVRNYPIYSSFKKREAEGSGAMGAVVYIGAVSRIRGIFEMIEVARLLAETGHRPAFRIIGPYASEAVRETAETLIEKYRLTGSVTLEGVIDHSRVYGILSQAGIGLALLHPVENYIKSMPIKLYEYMGSGVPIIASNFPAWQKLIDDHGCGICVDPFDIEQVAAAIRTLMENPSLRETMSQRGTAAVRESYNWEKESGKMLGIYSSILGEAAT